MKTFPFPIVLLAITGSAQASDPLCAPDFASRPLNPELIAGPVGAEHWREAQAALRAIETDAIETLRNAHGEWLRQARWNAVQVLEDKLDAIHWTLARDRVLLARYTLDSAADEKSRQAAAGRLREAQRDYCGDTPQTEAAASQ